MGREVHVVRWPGGAVEVRGVHVRYPYSAGHGENNLLLMEPSCVI